MHDALLAAVSSVYLLCLFAVASWGDARAAKHAKEPRRFGGAIVYAMAITVYNTAWSFYGSVGRAAATGWDFLPIYIGPTIILLAAPRLLSRIVALVRALNLTSISDFIAARYGKSRVLASSVTLASTLAMLPYLSLQLKAVSSSFSLLRSAPREGSFFTDPGLWTAVAMGAFTLIYGVRHLHTSERHRGLMLAVAAEGFMKIACFVIVSGFIVFLLWRERGPLPLHELISPDSLVVPDFSSPSWISNTLISAIAFLCLPHMFHVLAVENDGPDDLKQARWVFPLYLLVLSVFILPVAVAGKQLLGGDVSPDSYMLSIPISAGAEAFAFVAFLGGLSAATGMIIVAVVSLSTMLCNDLLLPTYLSVKYRDKPIADQDISRSILSLRRLSVVLVLALAYWLERILDKQVPLTQIGLMSFVAIAQFGPALFGAMYWTRGARNGAIAGLACGLLVWCLNLLLPSTGYAEWPLHQVYETLPGIAAVKSLGLDPISETTLISLGLNILLYFIFSVFQRQTRGELMQATAFAKGIVPQNMSAGAWSPVLKMEDLRQFVLNVAGPQIAHDNFDSYLADRRSRSGDTFGPKSIADHDAIKFTEGLLAGVVGAAYARILMASLLEGTAISRSRALAMLDDASEALRFSRELLQTTLENIQIGILVCDTRGYVAAYNTQFLRLMNLPANRVRVGLPLAEISHSRVTLEDIVSRAAASKRLQLSKEPQGTVEITSNELPGGGRVFTLVDVTEREEAAEVLRGANAKLEHRVQERTRELEKARLAADEANRSKSRLLAAASHDLLQPLNAARLFTAALKEEARNDPRIHPIAECVANSLVSAEQIVGTLLDISAIDAGVTQPHVSCFAIASILTPLQVEFAALANAKGLDLRLVQSEVAVRSDPRLLRRAVQNLIANAIAHTEAGRILIGVRRENENVRIEVWDQGPGIAPRDQESIFEEYKRLENSGSNDGNRLGLGLAIVQRISRVLNHPVKLRSRLGEGSCFSISVPVVDRSQVIETNLVESRRAGVALHNLLVLCIDDDAGIRRAMTSLLSAWNVECVTAFSSSDALCKLGDRTPDVLLLDYHLSGQATGADFIRSVKGLWPRAPEALIITADRSEEIREIARSLGASLLYKPAQPAALRRFLTRVAMQRTKQTRGGNG